MRDVTVEQVRRGSHMVVTEERRGGDMGKLDKSSEGESSVWKHGNTRLTERSCDSACTPCLLGLGTAFLCKPRSWNERGKSCARAKWPQEGTEPAVPPLLTRSAHCGMVL